MSYPIFGEVVEEVEDEKPSYPIFGEPFDEKAAFLSETTPQKILPETKRHILRSLSRGAETLLGLPSDILQTAQLGARGLEKGAAKIREKIGLKPLDIKESPPGLPGSQELRELSTKIFGKTVTPQNEAETFADEVISDAVTLALPIKGKIPFLRSIGTAVAGNIAQKGAEKLGIGEKGQIGAKLGTFFLAGLTGRGNVKKYWTEQYKKAQEAIPSREMVPTFRMERNLDKIQRELSKGIETPSKKFVLSPLNNIRKKIKTGRANVEDLIEMKKNLNEIRGKLYKDLTGKQSISYAQGKINDLANALDSEIAQYGRKNPTFFSHYKNANEAFSGFQQSKQFSRWLQQHINKIGKPTLILAEALFPKLLPTTAVGFVGLKGGELLTRVFKNPTLKRFYLNVLKTSAEGNFPSALKNLNKMKKEMEEKEPEIWQSLSSPTS